MQNIIKKYHYNNILNSSYYTILILYNRNNLIYYYNYIFELGHVTSLLNISMSVFLGSAPRRQMVP